MNRVRFRGTIDAVSVVRHWLLPSGHGATLEDLALRTVEASIAQSTGTALPSTADPLNSRVVLRDGGGATLRVTQPGDHDALRRFFHELSPESHRRRFFSLCDPSESLIETFCDSSNPKRQATMVALRPIDGELRPLAVASYLGIGTAVAEAAFAVGDGFQNKGLGTILLARLAMMAVANGFSRLEARVLAENNAMLEVFRDSGFEVRSTVERGAVTVILSLPVQLRAPDP